MNVELLNLYLFALAIAKEACITGIVPMTIIFYAAKMVASFERVPARKLLGKVVKGEGQNLFSYFEVGERAIDLVGRAVFVEVGIIADYSEASEGEPEGKVFYLRREGLLPSDDDGRTQKRKVRFA